jgi:ferritin-like metal-binding protein YciE
MSSDLHEILRRVEAYAKASGVTPDKVCRAATSNPRLYERLKRRAEQTQADVERLEKHMRENPPAIKRGGSGAGVQGFRA